MSTASIREFWNNRPCNIYHSHKMIGTRQYFNEVEARKYFVEPHIPGFADFDRWNGKNVLELGCGIGTDCVNFARHGATVTAVDFSERSMVITRRRFAVFGQHGKFYIGDMERLDKFLPKQTFDLVYAFGSIHHTVSPERVMSQIREYCHPNTEVRIMLYSRWSWKVLVDIILRKGHGKFWNWRSLVREYSEAQTGSPETYDYSFHEVRRLMKDFKIISMRKAHIFPWRVADYIHHHYIREWYFQLMPNFIFRLFERILGWHTLIVARPRRTS